MSPSPNPPLPTPTGTPLGMKPYEFRDFRGKCYVYVENNHHSSELEPGSRDMEKVNKENSCARTYVLRVMLVCKDIAPAPQRRLRQLMRALASSTSA